MALIRARLLCVALLLAICAMACGPDDKSGVVIGAGKTGNDAKGHLGDVADGGGKDVKAPVDSGSGDVGTPQDIGPPVCSPPCQPGYACYHVAGQPLCLVAPELACAPCSSDLHCLGGQCDLVDGQGPFCLTPCPQGAVGAANCPSGTTCSPGEDGHVCRPDANSCTCLPANYGKTRSCALPGAAACKGFRLCGPGGWTDCATPAKGPEICDGLDNDCDGKVDEGLPEGKPCTVKNEHGSCPGSRVCKGNAGWQCAGTAPAAEICNGADDDCDGDTDEPWQVDGKYIGDAHCGVCNNDCSGLYANGLGACDPDGFPPHCVLAKCDKGWVPGTKGCVPKPPDPCAGPTCPCTPALAGKQRVCSKTGVAGTCEGVETCKPPAGWLGCTAKQPGAEVCNGIDDDCDGVVDDGVGDGKACAIKNDAGTCKGTLICAGSAGAWCDGKNPKVETCNGVDDDCDGTVDDGFVNNKGLYLSVDHCGDCATSCAFPAGQHVKAACLVGAKGKPACSSKCESGWYDANEAVLDGCECKKTSEVDMPGGGDADCDGVDGEIDKSIFVAKSGDDANPGTRYKPVATIIKGLSLAAAQKKRDVLVGAGAYAGNLKLVAGVSIWGGYSKGFSSRDPANHESLVAGADPNFGDAMTVRCQGIKGSGQVTRIDGFTILGGTPKQAGRASFAIYSVDCDARFKIVANRIFAGNGGAGAGGGPGAHGKGGKGGKPGKKAKDIGHKNCSGWDHNSGGGAGVFTCGGQTVSGGNGGMAICPDFDEWTKPPQCPYGGKHKQTKTLQELGKPGHGKLPGKGGDAGKDAYIDPNNGMSTACKDPESSCKRCETGLAKLTGSDGAAGKSGGHGSPGAGCSAPGKVLSGKWQPGIGKGGGPAAHGSGGGGGGAAGGVEVVSCVGQAGYHDIGGSGGGGGSGGCGGGGGKPGASGGPSFAILIVLNEGAKSAPVLDKNVLHGGKGGDGGPGGPGGYGGFGGLGAPGGDHAKQESKSFCAHKGGAGAAGGQGGHGGGGGGGCGGPAALIAGQGVSTATLSGWQAKNLLQQPGTGGKAGAGGISAGKPGSAGLAGKVSKTLAF